MRKRLLIVLCFGIIACSVQQNAKNDIILPLTNVLSEKQGIMNCFSGYKSAIQNDKSVEAVEFVDRRTISYYQEILDDVKNADSTEVIEMNFMDRMMVFSIRHQVPKKDILQFDGKQLMAYTIQIGMVGANSFDRIEIGEIEIEEKIC